MPALVAGIHVFDANRRKAWAGTSPAMTGSKFSRLLDPVAGSSLAQARGVSVLPV
jgi:hypothetical protein